MDDATSTITAQSKSVNKKGTKRKRETKEKDTTSCDDKRYKTLPNRRSFNNGDESDATNMLSETETETETESEESGSESESSIDETKRPRKVLKRANAIIVPHDREEVEESEESDESGEIEESDSEDEKLNEFIAKIAQKMGRQIFDNAMAIAEEADQEVDGSEELDNPYVILNADGSSLPQANFTIEFVKEGGKPNTCREITRNSKLNLKKQPRNFVQTLSPEDRERLSNVERDILELNRQQVPPRYKILLSSMSLGSKAKVLSNMDRLAHMNSYSSEYSKLIHWLDGVISIPFGKYRDIPVTISSSKDEIKDYLHGIENTMEECIYGQKKAKEAIFECVGKWITNPNSQNTPLGFVGEKGTGKTTLAKYGIAQALGRPFCMISLGGESDASTFKGHDYTYEGARWGRIADMLISTQCMNPVIFFDELDKISETRAGQEITGMLMHLTDTTQNDKFTDKFFSGIDLDMSKCLFVFSYNESHKVNHILLDRIKEIKFDSFNKQDKVTISRKFLIPSICKNIGMMSNTFMISDRTILELINRYAPLEGGVRDLKRMIEYIFERLNLVQLPHNLNLRYKNVRPQMKDGRIHVTTDLAVALLAGVEGNELPLSARMMYT